MILATLALEGESAHRGRVTGVTEVALLVERARGGDREAFTALYAPRACDEQRHLGHSSHEATVGGLALERKRREEHSRSPKYRTLADKCAELAHS